MAKPAAPDFHQIESLGEDIKRYIGLYLAARFEGGRHERRVEKIREMEQS